MIRFPARVLMPIALLFVFSCGGDYSSSSETEPDIRLNVTHCIISESDQEPIVIDAESLELYSVDDMVVMKNAFFYQNKKGSDKVSISGRAGHLTLDSKNQDVHLTDGVELFIYPDDEETAPGSQVSPVDAAASGEDAQSSSELAVADGDAYEVASSAVDSSSIGSAEPATALESSGSLGLSDPSKFAEPDAPGDTDSKGDADLPEVSGDNQKDGLVNERKFEANKIDADEIIWGKYSKLLESPHSVSLEWEGTLIRGTGFKGNLNTGEFSFESVEEGRL